MRVFYTATELDHLKPILDNIAAQCHHLRSFCLSFMLNSHRHEILDGPALPLVDAFYHSKQLRDMRVAYWETYSYPSMNDHPRQAPSPEPIVRSLWRSLDGEEPSIEIRAIQRYPYPPLEPSGLDDGGERVESAGYLLLAWRGR
jgi:hypothetical protein